MHWPLMTRPLSARVAVASKRSPSTRTAMEVSAGRGVPSASGSSIGSEYCGPSTTTNGRLDARRRWSLPSPSVTHHTLGPFGRMWLLFHVFALRSVVRSPGPSQSPFCPRPGRTRAPRTTTADRVGRVAHRDGISSRCEQGRDRPPNHP